MTTQNFVWRGAEILAGVEDAVVDLVNENAEAVADKARSRVRKRTGNLADSIEVVPATITKRGIEATVRAGLYYGLFEGTEPTLPPASGPPAQGQAPQVADRAGGQGAVQDEAAGAGVRSPAYAGEPMAAKLPNIIFEVYPRVCGGAANEGEPS